MTSISFSYSPNPQNSASQPSEDLWSFSGVTIHNGPSGTVVLQHRDTDARMVVTAEVAQALKGCSPFRTLADHMRTIAERMPHLAGETAAIGGALKNVIDQGLMTNAKTVLAQLQSSPSTADHRQIPVRAFVITCDRPDLLQRLLNSMDERQLPPNLEGVWVIDDSRTPDALAANRSHCTRTIAGTQVHYVGAAERQDLIQHLIEALPNDEAAIRFALDQTRWQNLPTHGQARNVAQLMGVGYRCMVFDDDTLCHAVDPPLAAQGLRFASINERDAVLYENQEELDKHQLVRPESPIALMEREVGASLSHILSKHKNARHPAMLQGVDGELVRRFCRGGQVKLMQAGYWGDPGTADGNWLFHTPETTLKRLFSSQANLDKVLAARAAWTGFRGDTLTPYGSMSALTGLDNTDLLPPYFPVTRIEDILFAILLQRIYPSGAVLNAGWSIVHAPSEGHSSRAQLTPINAKPGLSNLVDWLGREPNDQWGVAPQLLLEQVAQQVRRLASMSEVELNALLRQEALSKQALLLQRAISHETQLKTLTDTSDLTLWQEFLEATRQALIDAVQTPEINPLSTLAQSAGGVEELRRAARDFAKSLKAWPEIRTAAAKFMLSSTA